MSRIFRRATLLCLALALPSSAAMAAIPPNPIQNRAPQFNAKTLDPLNESQRLMKMGKIGEAIRQLNLAASLEPNNPYVLARLGMALNMAGQYDDALTHLKRARKIGGADEAVLGPLLDAMLSMGQNQQVLDLFPDPPPDSRGFAAGMVLRARASAMQVMGDSAGASAVMQRSLAILNDYDGVMTAGRIALQQGDLDAADARVDEALKLRPRDTEARVLKIDVTMQKGLAQKAQAMAEQLVADNPRSVTARLIRIKLYLATGQTDKAGPDIDRITTDQPSIPVGHYFKALYLARRNDIKGAWSMAQSLPKEYIQIDPSVAVNVANMAIAAGFPDSGAAILSLVVQRFPWQLDARLTLADLRLRQKSPQYALNALTMVKDSQDPRVAVLFARIALMKNDPKTAQKYIRQAIEAGGGQELRSLEDKTVALKSLSDYSAAHPDNKVAKKQYAILLLGFGEQAKAKDAYEQLVRDDPTDAVALNNLAWLVVQQNPSRALALAQRAAKADPASANYMDTLGSMQMTGSDFKGAVASLQKAHDMEPQNPSIAYRLALALEASGAKAQSQTLLEALVKRGGFSDWEAAKSLLASKLKLASETPSGR